MCTYSMQQRNRMKFECKSFVQGSIPEPAMLVLLLDRFDHDEAIGEVADSEFPGFHAATRDQVLDRIGFLACEVENEVSHFPSGPLARGIVGIDHLGKIAGGLEGIGPIQGIERKEGRRTAIREIPLTASTKARQTSRSAGLIPACRMPATRG